MASGGCVRLNFRTNFGLSSSRNRSRQRPAMSFNDEIAKDYDFFDNVIRKLDAEVIFDRNNQFLT